MSNNLLTISMITNDALMVLENETVFSSAVTREYDDQFAVTGAKIGSTLNIRRPARFVGTSGPALNVEDFNETYLPLTLSTQFHVDTQFTTQDLALSLGAFSDRVTKPAVAAIANKVDYDGLTMAKNNTANIVGVAGQVPTSLLTYLTAGAYISAEAGPTKDRTMLVEPFTGATIVDSLKGLFTPSDKIGAQYTNGMMGRDAAGMNWKMDQNIISHTFGSWASTPGTVTLTGAGGAGVLASGWASTSTLTCTTNQTLTLQQGDVITLAGVYAVNPQSRQPYGSNRLRNFVVQTAVTASSGAFNLTVAPAVIYGGQFQNVSAAPASTAAITPFSIAGTTATAITAPQNILTHKNAFTLGMADLEMPQGVHFAGRASDKEVGMSIRIVRQYTINNDSIPARFDVLYGWAPLYQELACRVSS